MVKGSTATGELPARLLDPDVEPGGGERAEDGGFLRFGGEVGWQGLDPFLLALAGLRLLALHAVPLELRARGGEGRDQREVEVGDPPVVDAPGDERGLLPRPAVERADRVDPGGRERPDDPLDVLGYASGVPGDVPRMPTPSGPTTSRARSIGRTSKGRMARTTSSIDRTLSGSVPAGNASG